MVELSDVEKKFILHWGEMGSLWGTNRTVAQIHALLYIAPEPLHAAEIASTLDISRSNVSNSLKELRDWNIINVVQKMGDRRDYFESLTDIWEMFDRIVTQRKEREIDPTLEVLQDCVQKAKNQDTGNEVLVERLEAMEDFIETMVDCFEDVNGLPLETKKKLASMGGTISSLLE